MYVDVKGAMQFEKWVLSFLPYKNHGFLICEISIQKIIFLRHAVAASNLANTAKMHVEEAQTK